MPGSPRKQGGDVRVYGTQWEFFTEPPQASFFNSTDAESNRLASEMLAIRNLGEALRFIRANVDEVSNILWAKPGDNFYHAASQLSRVTDSIIEAQHHLDLAQSEVWEALRNQTKDERMID